MILALPRSVSVKSFWYDYGMKSHFRTLGFLLALPLFATPASAGVFSLPSLGSPSQVTAIANVFASTMRVSSVEPAADVGRFGFGFGIVPQGALTAQISSLLPSGPPALPFANAYLSFYAPLGISLDVIGVPPINIPGIINILNVGGNLKWTFTRLFPDVLPFDLAVQLTGSYGTLGTTQPYSGTTIDVYTRSVIMGASAGISKALGFFEPYLWLGALNHSSSFNVTAATPVQFVQYLGSSTSTSIPASNFNLFAALGYQLHLGFFAFGMEGSYSFGNIGANLKLGFKF